VSAYIADSYSAYHLGSYEGDTMRETIF